MPSRWSNPWNAAAALPAPPPPIPLFVGVPGAVRNPELLLAKGDAKEDAATLSFILEMVFSRSSPGEERMKDVPQPPATCGPTPTRKEDPSERASNGPASSPLQSEASEAGVVAEHPETENLSLRWCDVEGREGPGAEGDTPVSENLPDLPDFNRSIIRAAAEVPPSTSAPTPLVIPLFAPAASPWVIM
jgi:hypothetical protein